VVPLAHRMSRLASTVTPSGQVKKPPRKADSQFAVQQSVFVQLGH